MVFGRGTCFRRRKHATRTPRTEVKGDALTGAPARCDGGGWSAESSRGRPGGGAWAFRMGRLGLVSLLSWMEGSGLAVGAGGWDRLRLDSPWTLFYGLLVLAGGTNFLPTRYGPAAACLILAFVLEYLGL